MENKKQKINWRLLVTVARGEAKPGDLIQFNNWLNESPEQNRLIYEEIKKDFGAGGQSSAGAADDTDGAEDTFTDTATAFAQLGIVVAPPEEESEELPPKSPAIIRLPFRWLRTAGIAACFALLCVGGWWFSQSGPFLKRQENIAAQYTDWQEVTVALGRQVNLSLDDGSVIRLAPGSKFRYPKAFNDTERRVYLEGEAFFEVSKDAARPFIVQTSSLETRVLGTSFNIESFQKQTTAKVTVVTGKVAVSKQRNGSGPQLLAYLTPNEAIEFSSDSDTFNVSNMPVHIVQAIKNGKLVFDGSSMNEIGEALQRRYGVTVHFSDEKIKTMRLTTMLDYMSIDHLAEMLSLATGLKVTHRSGELYFDRK